MSSPYAQNRGGGGSSYAQNRGAGGSAYAQPRPQSAPQTSDGKKSSGGFLHALEKYSGAELAGNLAKDVGSTAVGVGPGIADALKTTYQQTESRITGNKKAQKKADAHAADIAKGVVKQYKDYYGHDVAHHLYTHPLQPLLDVLTVASGGRARWQRAASSPPTSGRSRTSPASPSWASGQRSRRVRRGRLRPARVPSIPTSPRRSLS